MADGSWYDTDIDHVIISEQQIRDKIDELAKQVSVDHTDADEGILLVCVLKGAVMFMADLARQVDLPLELDFMAVSSYGSATKTSGVVRIVKDLDIDLSGRDVLVVEDIVDSGLTLNYLLKNLAVRNPASLEVCALLLKEGQQKAEPPLRYIGFRIPNTFLVGYGLDVAERYRNMRDIRTYLGSV
jgi:hypoxanthine phosphoribosyltransferase